MGTFQFVVLSSLRAVQLTRGCRPRVEVGDHKRNVIAQMEVAEGKVFELLPGDVPVPTAAVEAPPDLVPVEEVLA
jgi:hypothetical protein